MQYLMQKHCKCIAIERIKHMLHLPSLILLGFLVCSAVVLVGTGFAYEKVT
jgi:hypothetical protein